MNLNGLTYEVQGQVGIIYLNRPEKLNAIDTPTSNALIGLLDEIQAAGEVRCIVLTGVGRAFCAGGDISEESEKTVLSGYDFSVLGHAMTNALASCRLPIIAAINGYALGGGLEYALSCDFRFASSTAKIGAPESNLGVIPGAGGTQRLPRLVGVAKAKEIIFTGRKYTAEECLSFGLVDRVFEPDALLPETLKFAEELAGRAPQSIRLCKFAIDRGMEMDLASALDLEATLYGLVHSTYDAKEGLTAFLEKRTPKFEGR